MKGASVKKIILRFFSGNDPFCHFQKFQPWQTPPSHFLTISPRFLTSIRCRYFSLNIWIVYEQLGLDLCIFDQNWAKTRPLHVQIFQILNAIDRRIVQWLLSTSNINWELIREQYSRWKTQQEENCDVWAVMASGGSILIERPRNLVINCFKKPSYWINQFCCYVFIRGWNGVSMSLQN